MSETVAVAVSEAVHEVVSAIAAVAVAETVPVPAPVCGPRHQAQVPRPVPSAALASSCPVPGNSQRRS